MSSLCCVLLVSSGNQKLEKLQKQVDDRMRAALRPRTSCSYLAAFRQFVAFLVITGLNIPYHESVIVIYLEYLVQQGLRCCSVRNHISVLKHYFALFNWPVMALSGRKVSLLLTSVKVNATMLIRIKGIFTLSLLEKLISKTLAYENGYIFAALFVTAFFGFFRLSTLLPANVAEFDRTRFPIQNDVIWGAPGVHIIITCSKTMQASNQAQVVQLPALKCKLFCPVNALKNLLAKTPRDKNFPLFQIHTKQGWIPLTASKARSFLCLVIVTMGLNPSSYTFHAFRCSGASLVFNNSVELSKIKQHGNWKSEAIWTYLNSTPVAAGIVPSTFKQLLSTNK